MADNIWDNSGADNDGNVAANWSLERVPTGTDVAVFDHNTTDDNCTFSGVISCAGMRFDNAYAGVVDAVTFDIALGASGLDCTGGGSATLDLGSGKWTCSGNWDDNDIGTKTYSAGSEVELSSGTLATGYDAGDAFYDLTIAGNVAAEKFRCVNMLTANVGCTLTANGTYRFASITCNGTINHGHTYPCSLTNGCTITVGASGAMIGGSATSRWTLGHNGTIDNSAGGTWSIQNTLLKGRDINIKGTFACTDLLTLSGLYVYGGAWNFVFSGDVTFNCDFKVDGTTSTGSDIVVDAATHDVNVTFNGDVDFAEDNSAISFSEPATGTVTFDGMTAYNDSTAAGINLGDVEVSGYLQLDSNMECDEFSTIGTGTIDPNGQTLTANDPMDWTTGFQVADPVGSTFSVGGNFTANAQDISGATGEWFLQVTGTAVASGEGDVAYSNAAGFTEIDASAGPWTDSGNNTNWGFGAEAPSGLSIPIAMHHYTKNIAAGA